MKKSNTTKSGRTHRPAFQPLAFRLPSSLKEVVLLEEACDFIADTLKALAAEGLW